MSAILRLNGKSDDITLLGVYENQSNALIKLKDFIEKYQENGYEIVEKGEKDIFRVDMCKSENGWVFNSYEYITLKIETTKREPLFYTKHVMNINLINELKKKHDLKKVILHEKKIIKTTSVMDKIIDEMRTRRKSTSFDLVEDESDNEEF